MNECIQETTGNVTCSEGKCCFKIDNKSGKTLKKYYIDGCLVPNDSQHKRCDFGIESEELFWIVELKGANFSDAIDQIISTISNFDIVPDGKKITPVVISTRSPAATQKPSYLKRLKKALGDQWS